MKAVIAAIEATHQTEVRAGGFFWRVRRVDNDLTAQRNAITLLMIMPRSEDERLQDEAVARLPPEKQPEALVKLRWERTRRRIEELPEIQAKLNQNRRDIVRAGVVAISLDGEEWEPIELVETEAEHAPTADPPRIWRGRFNPEALDALFAAIWDLCTDGGAAIARIERFRRGNGATGAPGRAGKKVRPTANRLPKDGR